MATQAARAFTKETVHVDGQQFIDCEFKGATMIFSGGEVPAFTGCHFDACHWAFEGTSLRTVQYLRFLYGSGNAAIIDGLNRELQRP